MPSIARAFCVSQVLTIASENRKEMNTLVLGFTTSKYAIFGTSESFDLEFILSISKFLSHVDTSNVKKEKRGYDTTFLLIVLRMKLP